MKIRFVHITCTSKANIFGLDSDGRVWHYIPYRPGKENDGKGRFAFWTKLTDFGRDPSDPKVVVEA